MNRTIAALIALGVSVMNTHFTSGAVPIPSDKQSVQSLDGTWRFKLEQTKGESESPSGVESKTLPVDYPKEFEPFFKPDYKEAGEWKDIKVPGNWEMPGFSPATYNQPDNASGFYRREFDVPADWKGRVVKVNFDGIQNGAEIYINGAPAKVDEPSWGRDNYHESGWTAFQADLTPHITFGEKNLLAIRVTKNTKSSDLDSGDYFFLGGVHRPVTLFAVPQTHFDDVTVQTKVLEGGKGEVKVIAKVVGGDASNVYVNIQGAGDAEAKVENGQAVVTKVVDDAKLWSAEFPNLYPTTVELKSADGKVLHQHKHKIGIREVTIKDSVLLINGTKVKFAGMCRHDVSADEGTATTPAIWRIDIELMKAANINAIRTSHYPYGKGFYELCDELGMYVVDELPYCWTPTNDKELEPAFTQRAREAIARDKNFACVIVWAVGNENKEGRNLQVVADLVKELDTTRPRAVSWFAGDKYNTELSDSHYTRPDAIDKAGVRALAEKKPHIYLENPNNWEVRLAADPGAWDRWTPVLERCWDVVTKHDTIPGTFSWEWQDRAVADKSPTKMYSFFPETGIHLLKIKGIVDAFRNPRPWYYNVKMVYSPIRFGDHANVSTNGEASFEIENRYSFTDLKTLQAKWQLRAGDKTIAEGDTSIAVAPLSKKTVEVALPAEMLGDAHTLLINFVHPAGHHVVGHQFALKETKHSSGFDPSLPKDLKFPRFNLITRKTERDPKTWRKITRYVATIENVKMQPSDGSLATVKKMSADIIGGPDKTVVGKLSATFDGNELKYTVKWNGAAKTEVQELGWVFEMPKSCDHFAWDRQARWTVYPEKHIGRAHGVATPDSMNVPFTKMDRADAYDFNSTKYDCNWASLADWSGNGVCVEFSSDQRFHCRGGVSEDSRSNVLFVNQQVSPPDDLSSNVVRDFYMTLNPGDKIEGSFRVGSTKR